MRPLFPQFSVRSWLGLSCALLAAALLGACDGHSPQEIPESYGHGSSHDKSYKDHQTDSHPESRSFSDTEGVYTNGETDETKRKPQPNGSPGASQLPARFFPKDS